MAKHMFVERRAYRRYEEAPAAEAEKSQKHDDQRQQAIVDEVAELSESSDEVLDHIDEVLALEIGHLSLGAA